MNPSKYYGRSEGYKRASSSHNQQSQPGRPAPGALGTRGSCTQEQSCGYGKRPLNQRHLQHYPAHPQLPEQDDISDAFTLLRFHPQQALNAAEILLNQSTAHPSGYTRIVQLKARALFQLHKFDDCIAFINTLETRVRADKGLLMAKARALQVKGCFNEALPLLQRLYAKHQVAYKDHKAHALGLGRLLQLMGGEDNLQQALTIFTRLRTRTAGGRVNTACNDKDIELTLGRHLQLMGGADNLEKARAIFTRLRTWRAAGRINTPCDDKEIELALGRHLQIMGGEENLEKALAIFTRLRCKAAGGRLHTPCNDKDIELSLGRLLQLMGGADNLQQARYIVTRLRTWHAGGRVNTPCDDKDIELTLGRHLQIMGGAHNLDMALAIYTRLRTQAAAGRINTPCDDKNIELTLGRHLELMGGSDNLQQALEIFTRLRTRMAGGRVNTPCHDKDIELTLGRLLQLMGGRGNLEKALAIFTRLRTWHAAGRQNTPCNDKEIELALGRHLQIMGGAQNLEKALAIFTRLRARAAAGKVDTPCNDKEIELALGRHLQIMGGAHNLDLALVILTRLRARAAGGRINTSCDDKDIELALASLFIDRKNWPAFDELRLETRRFPGFEPHLCLSIRYFNELLETESISPAHSRLLGKMIGSAVLAMEESGCMNASCLSQLAHCLRLLSDWPDDLLQERGIQHQAVRSLSTAATFLFDTADMMAPCRQWMEKDQHWRKKEKRLLTLLARQRNAGSLQCPLTP